MATKKGKAPLGQINGGKGPRQRAWDAMRAKRGEKWTLAEIMKTGRVNESSIRWMVRGLERAGYVEEVERVKSARSGPACTGTIWYRLIRDTGVEAPRLNSNGEPTYTRLGRGRENLWQAMRHFLSDFTHYELAAYARTPEVPISDVSAQTYVLALAAAGYLECVKPVCRVRGRASPGRYRLLPHMNTGPRPPILTHSRSVFDTNQARLVWREEPNLEEELDHA